MKAPTLLLATIALLIASKVHCADYRNEIGASAATGITSSDPGGYGSIFYQRVFDGGAFVGGALGAGSVLPERKSVRFSVRGGYRLSVSGWGTGFQPQASIEAAAPWLMSADNGYGVYLNLGMVGILQERFLYGLELQLGEAKQSEVGLPNASGSVTNLRASLAYRF